MCGIVQQGIDSNMKADREIHLYSQVRSLICQWALSAVRKWNVVIKMASQIKTTAIQYGK